MKGGRHDELFILTKFFHTFRVGRRLKAYGVPESFAFSVFFCLFPRCVPPFASLLPVLLADPYRLHLLEWNCVMVPEHVSAIEKEKDRWKIRTRPPPNAYCCAYQK